MTPEQAVGAVSRGNVVECDAADYPAIRHALQSAAGRWIDAGDGFRAQIALAEVRRLDRKHAGSPQGDGT